MFSPRIVDFPPVFFDIGFPHDLQLISLVAWEKITCFSWQLAHCTDKKLLFGFGIRIFSLLIVHHNLRLDFQLAHSHTFFHCFTLTIFAGISKSNLLCSLGGSFKLWKLLSAISFLVFCMSSCSLSSFSIFSLLVYGHRLNCVLLAFWAEFIQLFPHFHILK